MRHGLLTGLTRWQRPTFLAGDLLTVALVAVLVCLVAVNMYVRSSYNELEDGVLWVAQPEGLTASDVAERSAATEAGIQRGDILLAVDGIPVESLRELGQVLHEGRQRSVLTYTILRLGSQDVRQVVLQAVPQGNRGLYYVLAAVAIFTLLVGASVFLRRAHDPATVHFFWLSVAFFGVFGFSPSGRFDRLDWFFYWADQLSLLALPALFVHFALEFPERAQAWARTHQGRRLLPLLYLPAMLLGGARAAMLSRPMLRGAVLTEVLKGLDRLDHLYLGAALVTGLAVMMGARHRVRSMTARRQLRWIMWGTTLGALPFVLGYALPWVLGVDPWPRTELLAIPLGLVPLAFASAVVRYRLMDVEVIIKRSLVYAAAASAIAAIYAVLLRVAREVFLGGSERHNTIIALLATLVVILLARPVRDLIQTVLDRAYYRDRYDYRRALVAFARELNSDLDLARLSERLVTRVTQTLAVDRMVLMLSPGGGADGDRFVPIRAAGFLPSAPPPALSRLSGIGGRLLAGHHVSLDDPLSVRRFSSDEVSFWLAAGIHYFTPCVSKDGTIAVMVLGRKERGEPLNSEDVTLLSAVAGQVATALENGRLYRELRLKADEFDRLREFNENIVESLDNGLVVLDMDDRVVRWNRGCEQLHGVPAANAVGQPLATLFDPAFVEQLHAARREFPDGMTLYRLPLESRRHDEPKRLRVNASTVPLRNSNGATTGTILILKDITERVQLEEQLQIADKMASIGLLAAGVAHEVNTPLTGISSFTQMLLEQAEPSDGRTALLRKIEQQTFRAAKIVNGLLSLARPARTETASVDVNTVINDVLALLEHQFRTTKIQVRKELSPTPPMVLGNEYKLQQVFLNLFINARDAMPRGGWLSIRTSMEPEHAVIEVADTGSGIPSEHLPRIYDPFFTTKPLGKGTGLGLSVAYGIVQEHGGTITCDSGEGQGTRFSVLLPAVSQAGTRLAQ